MRRRILDGYARALRRLVPLIAALAAAAPAAAAIVHARPAGGLLLGTPKADTLVGGARPDLIQAAFGGDDTVRCGAGQDVVSADLGDKVAADCEVVARRLSVDPSTNPGSQHETAVEPDVAAWASTVVADFQLGRYENGAASTIGTAVSYDSGRTWRRAILPGLTVESKPAGTQLKASDPTIAYDAEHGIWLAGSLTIQSSSLSHVLVNRSSDGLRWSRPVTVGTGPALDKDWFVCDNGAASPYRGRCYAAYTDDAENSTIVQSSDDGGLTWSEPLHASGILVGTQPVVQPSGKLVIVAGDYDAEAALTGAIDSLVSTDGGATFSRWEIAKLKAKSNAPLRAVALPSVAVDSNGTIYATWHDCRFRKDCSGNDLVLSVSGDGITWTSPARIPLPTQAFLPGLSTDPATPLHLGLVYAYFVPGSCPKACALGVGAVSSFDGGRTWSASVRLDAQPVSVDWIAKTDMGRMVGDYFASAWANGRLVPVFALAAPPLKGRFQEAVFAASLAPSSLRARR